ncbi:MAG: ribosome small subunit-dependent GTPase [Bacteroidetes bacterium]|jgi:ribosome biogenesis GTPase|nr:ribosome small subunit-dependent GTPase [Bacteroidota bacterium]
MRGLVTKSTGSWYSVRMGNGEHIDARLAGKMRLEGRKSTNPVVVGDWVEFVFEDEEKKAVIQTVAPRKNYIIRRSLNLSKQTHILASNIDQAVLVATLAFPRTSTGFIDRFLVTCEAYTIPVCIVFNKKDLMNEAMLEVQQEMMDVYTKIGYECMLVSATDSKDLESIKELLKDKTTLIAGHSGVGKSTLINSIQPDLDLKTGKISNAHSKGKHTTTFTELFELDFGGFVIDSPGIKELGLVEMKREEVGHYFPEIREHMSDCKFNNCTHENEPACAVKKAVETGEIDEERYYNYLKMLHSDEMNWNDWEVE